MSGNSWADEGHVVTSVGYGGGRGGRALLEGTGMGL